MSPEQAYAEALKSLNACRERMANIHKLTSNTEHRRDLLAVDMAHELALLAVLANLSHGDAPPEGKGTSHWDRIRQKD